MSVDGKSLLRALLRTVPSQDTSSATTLGTHSTVEPFESIDEILTVPLASTEAASGNLDQFKEWTWGDLARHVEALISACKKGGMRDDSETLSVLEGCWRKVNARVSQDTGNFVSGRVDLKDLFQQSTPPPANSLIALAQADVTELLNAADKVLEESKNFPSLQKQPIWKAAATVVVGLLLTAGFAALSFITFGASTLIAALAFGAIIAVGVSGSTLGGAYHHFERKNAEFVDLMRHAVPDLRAAFVAVPREESDHIQMNDDHMNDDQMNDDADNESSVQQPVPLATGRDGHNSGDTVLTGVDGEEPVETEVPQPNSEIFDSINLDNSFTPEDLREALGSGDGKKADNLPV